MLKGEGQFGAAQESLQGLCVALSGTLPWVDPHENMGACMWVKSSCLLFLG